MTPQATPAPRLPTLLAEGSVAPHDNSTSPSVQRAPLTPQTMLFLNARPQNLLHTNLSSQVSFLGNQAWEASTSRRAVLSEGSVTMPAGKDRTLDMEELGKGECLCERMAAEGSWVHAEFTRDVKPESQLEKGETLGE